jgi:hypothetical protein
MDEIKLQAARLNIATYKNKPEEIIEMMKDRNIDIFGMAKVKMKGHE